jgi:hypothetical protein
MAISFYLSEYLTVCGRIYRAAFEEALAQFLCEASEVLLALRESVVF